MIVLSVRVSTVSSQWLDIFIQFSVGHLNSSSAGGSLEPDLGWMWMFWIKAILLYLIP